MSTVLAPCLTQSSSLSTRESACVVVHLSVFFRYFYQSGNIWDAQSCSLFSCNISHFVSFGVQGPMSAVRWNFDDSLSPFLWPFKVKRMLLMISSCLGGAPDAVFQSFLNYDLNLNLYVQHDIKMQNLCKYLHLCLVSFKEHPLELSVQLFGRKVVPILLSFGQCTLDSLFLTQHIWL